MATPKVLPVANLNWRFLENFKYAVSERGDVISYRKGFRVLGYVNKRTGYVVAKVKLGEGAYKNTGIHRLVALAFIPNPKGYPDVNHKDGNKLNNHYSNLEWCTKSQNVIHSLDAGLHSNPRTPVVCKETGEVFKSQVAAAKALGLYQPNISKVVLGERAHTSGYTFKKVGSRDE